MNNKLLVIGAGGHARSVLDIALQNKDYSQIACIDSLYPKTQHVEWLEEVPIIGNDSDMEALYSQGYNNVFIALGDNKLRHKLFYHALSLGFKPVNILSRYSVISPRVQLGKGICIMAGAVININTVIEDNCVINTRCSIDHDCHIMESSHIAPGVTLSGNVCVGQGTWIGTGASVIDKMSIGKWSYIGSGAVVISDLEPNALYYGVPAKKIKPL
jgi:UDP-perosamine 4-acetyltransferase